MVIGPYARIHTQNRPLCYGYGGASVLGKPGMTPDTMPWTLYGEPYYDSEIIYYAIGY